MPSSGFSGQLWPNDWQETLLDAIASADSVAVAAFRRWSGRPLREEDFDAGTRRLLPLVYHRMQALGVTDPMMGRLKGMYRRAWYKNNAVFHASAPVVALLESNGVPTLLLKGAPLAVTYYDKIALRPMADIHIMVPPAQALAAIALLRSAGWHLGGSARLDDLGYRHSMQFVDGNGRELDLHWHALLETCNAPADTHFWRSAEPLLFEGVATRQLSPGNALLHGIVHGLRWNPEPPIRWIPDSLAVLRGAGERIDWADMLAFARAQRLTHRLGLGLIYLARRYAAPVPEAVLRELAATPISLTERIENTIVLRDAPRIFAHPIGKFWILFAEYVRFAHGRPQPAVGFSHYVRYRLRLRGRMELVKAAWRSLWRFVAGRAG